MSEPSGNNSELDEYGVWIKKSALDSNEKGSVETEAEISALPEISDIEETFSFDTPDIVAEDLKDFETQSEEIDVTTEKDFAEAESSGLDASEEEAIANEISDLENIESETDIEPETVATEEVVPTTQEDTQTFPIANDGEIDLNSFMDDSTSSDGDVDLSAFMGGSDESVSFGDGDIDLSAFMGGESFASKKEEVTEIEDADPLDIDLEFEETDIDFQENDEDNSSFTGVDNEEDNFDDLFEDIKDETPEPDFIEPEPVHKTESVKSGEEIDLSDFGFTDDSENLNPVIGDGNEKKVPDVVNYEMNVDIEEDDSQAEKADTKIETNNEEEDITVDISMDAGKAEQKEQKTDLSSPDDSFDIDSIFSNIEDENGETVSFENESSATSSDSDGTKEELDVTDTTILEETSVSEEELQPLDDVFTEQTEVENTSFEDLSSTEDQTVVEEDFSFGEEPVTNDTVTDTQETIDTPIEDIPSLDEVDFSFDEESTIDNTSVETQAETTDLSPEDIPPLVEEDFSFGEEPVTNDTVTETQTEGEESSFKDVEEDFSLDEEPFSNDASTEETQDSFLEDLPPLVEEDFSFGEEPVTNDTVTETQTEGEESPIEDITIVDRSSNTAEETEFVQEEPLDIEDIPDIEEETGIGQDEITKLESDLENNIEPLPTAEEVFEEPEVLDENESSLSAEEETNDTISSEDSIDVSSYINKGPDYDMSGVSVTLDDLDNISEIPEEIETLPPSDADENVTSPAEDTSVTGNEEKYTYSVFVKTDDSSSKIEDSTLEYDNTETAEEDFSEEQMQDENQMKQKNDFNSEEILSKIAEDLASLKTEINGLKDEFEEIKKNGIPTERESEELYEQSLDNIPVQPTKESSGFFSGTDEDDTIALSGDELGNILNSAEFTEANDENETNGEIIEELESVNESEAEPLIEEEITVPTVDKAEESENKPHVITDKDIPSPTLERFDLPPMFDENGLIEKAEPLTEDNIEYLTSEIPEEMREENEEDENLEVGISEQPVESVFSNWQATSKENDETTTEDTLTETQEEPVEDSLSEIQEKESEEPVIEEKSSAIEAEDKESSLEKGNFASGLKGKVESNEIPADMKEEIKSVLSYMDQLLENLPEEKIAEFARSEQFETYKKLFSELGLS